jgi:pseudouridine synthase
MASRAAGAKADDWLLRALQRAGVEQAETRLSEGLVKVDGQVVYEPFRPVTPTTRVEVEGQPVDLTPRTRVLAFHKPKGLVTDTFDRERIGTVFEALALVLPTELAQFTWHAVGRLDRDTTGLLLFTTDERFVQHATSPQSHLPKRYVAQVGATVTEAKLDRLRAGLELHDGPTRPAVAEVLGPKSVALTLTEGRNHQVKRMLGEVGLPTLSLHREAIGQYVLDVAEGTCRLLADEEIQRFFGFTPRG